MKKNISLIIATICLLTVSHKAIGYTPIESFISRVKETNKFVTINNIWQRDNNFDKSGLFQNVADAQPLTINYSAVSALLMHKNMAITLQIPSLNGVKYEIELARYDFLSNDFQVHTLGENNKDILCPYAPGLYYRGIVSGIPGSIAAFSFFNNEVYGIFSIPGEGNYTLVPNTMVGNYYDHNTHYILYNDNDLKIKEHGPDCATDQLPEMEMPSAKTTTTLNNKVYNSCTEVRVFEVADYATYVRKGSNTTNVTNYLTALFNNQSTIYRNEGVPIVLKYIQINTASDPYQAISSANSSLFLDEFGQITQNTLHGCDLALLFSTRYGTMGGVAWVRSMCSPYSSFNNYGPYGFCNIDAVIYNFPTYSWDVEVTTHEMGHIVGSPHTHRCCWNPPARNTAIDGCYTLEGSCPMPIPKYPTGGGTIMSYCHLTSTGINFSKGFGQQPGDTVRYFLSRTFSSTCGERYYPSVALTSVNTTKSANRECTDLTTGYTYYWNDNNTASQTDDTLVLMINKNGNNIGTLDSSTFSASTSTLSGYGSGSGISVSFPAGTTGASGTNISMQRYWRVTPSSNPTTAVEVVFPFTLTDTSDVDGTVSGEPMIGSYRMYKVNSPIDPNPASAFSGATSSNFSVYTYGSSASTSNWSLTTSGSTYLAHMKMTNLACGGSGFTPNSVVGINEVDGGGAYEVYPNPVRDYLHISLNKSITQDVTLRLYTLDGKMISARSLQPDITNVINLADLANGIYYYHIVSKESVYTGKIVKN